MIYLGIVPSLIAYASWAVALSRLPASPRLEFPLLRAAGRHLDGFPLARRSAGRCSASSAARWRLSAWRSSICAGRFPSGIATGNQGTKAWAHRLLSITLQRDNKMASAFSRFRGEEDLEAQVAHLAKEMSALKKSLSKHGSDVYDDARVSAADFYGELRDRFSDALPMMRRRTRAAGAGRARPSGNSCRRRPGRGRAAGDDAGPPPVAGRKKLSRRSRRSVLPGQAPPRQPLRRRFAPA